MTGTPNNAKKSDIAQREERILAFWKDNNIFEKTLEKKAPKGEFVFYDGPPFATGLPHYGSLLGSIAKDVFGRYKTMQGYHVRRRWGWDCHGLPIENMIEKQLGLSSKKEIEKIGVKKFNETCRASVLQYAHDWQWYIDRVGRWVEFENSYKTMDATYSESVWWAIKQMYDKGLVYEGRKVLLYCPRCETPLAKAEVAMDNSYKDISEEAVTVKFELVDEPGTYVLAWTTTPWTLPGNVALAVGADLDYVKIKHNGEQLILAKERLEIINGEYEILDTQKGSTLVGKSYKALYPFPENIVPDDQKANYKNAYKIYDADFVTTEDGTGVVHTAVLYGEDDYQLGLKVGLPMVQLLDSRAHFIDIAPEFIRGAFFKQSEKLIKKDLEERGLMFERKNHTHSYPHCHRCDTPLIYNAISSWFINIQDVKSTLLKNNEDINWIPDHLKHGRFKHIVDSAPDWTISRNRYWATPMPIWKGTQTGKVYVMGGLDELKQHIKTAGNTYLFMRHAEAEKNLTGEITSQTNDHNPLTERGRQQAHDIGKTGHDIDLIIASPLMRTQETAKIVAEELGLQPDTIITDDRIIEIQMGDAWEGKKWQEFHDTHQLKWHFDNAPEGGESRMETIRRVGEFLYDLENKYSGKRILIVTHGAVLGAAKVISSAMTLDHAREIYQDEIAGMFKTGTIYDFGFSPVPHNDNYELDFHRPYIDEIELVAPDGEKLERIPEVLDGWVDSATMPFAEYHYPFENKNEFEKRFPGDYVAEYIAQTRTWFYYMHAIGNILFGKAPFKNVLTTGNILAEDGAKMSKSKGNYTGVAENFDNVGADAMRYYLMTSVVMRAEDVRFVDREMVDVKNRLVNILGNVVRFYEMYSSETEDRNPYKSPYVLDRWILALLDELKQEVTSNLNEFNTVKAGRPIGTFVLELSQWYIRRSRDRFKGDDAEDKAYALATTQYVLIELAKLLAPFTPFMADDVYQRAGGPLESVHLETWPTGKRGFRLFKKKSTVIDDMARVRRIISAALEARDRAGIKVRQPLQSLTVTETFDPQYQALITDEVNLKEVIVGDTLRLDTDITPELAAEGHAREFIRHVQSMRKNAKLEPDDKITLIVQTTPEGKNIITKFSNEITATAGVLDIMYSANEGDVVQLGDITVTVALKK